MSSQHWYSIIHCHLNINTSYIVISTSEQHHTLSSQHQHSIIHCHLNISITSYCLLNINSTLTLPSQLIQHYTLSYQHQHSIIHCHPNTNTTSYIAISHWTISHWNSIIHCHLKISTTSCIVISTSVYHTWSSQHQFNIIYMHCLLRCAILSLHNVWYDVCLQGCSTVFSINLLSWILCTDWSGCTTGSLRDEIVLASKIKEELLRIWWYVNYQWLMLVWAVVWLLIPYIINGEISVTFPIMVGLAEVHS